MTSNKQNILITGASGLIGTAVWKNMSDSPDRYALTGFDLAPDPSKGKSVIIGNINDFAAVRRAIEGRDQIVHLGANAGAGDLWDRIRESNLIGTYNVFEAAREAGVKRVIVASTGQVTWNYEQEPPLAAVIAGRHPRQPGGYRKIDHTWPVRPSGLYAASKVWGESLGRYYSDVHGISVLVIRFSAVNRPDTPLNPTGNINPGDFDAPGERSFSLWTSQRDAAQLVRLCVDAPESLKFDIFYSGSDNRWGVRDISHAEHVLGYRPQDRAEDHRR